MKKTALATALMLFVIGSTTTTSSANAQIKATTTSGPNKIKPAVIPPPLCPRNDPSGCGIYDGL